MSQQYKTRHNINSQTVLKSVYDSSDNCDPEKGDEAIPATNCWLKSRCQKASEALPASPVTFSGLALPPPTPAVAFHSPTTRIKKEPQSPRTDPALSCSRKPPLPYHHGEQCLYSR